MTDFSDRDHFRVTTKAAIFSPDGTKVIVMKILGATRVSDDFGLPGGHLDAGEDPDTAMQREIKEELGVEVDGLTRKDFFMHPNGKVVLAFTARCDANVAFFSSEPEKEHGQWMNRQEIEACSISEPYRQFVLAHWPAA